MSKKPTRSGKPDKAKIKPKAKAKTKPAPMTLEKMSFQDQQRLLNNHVSKLIPALADQKAAKADADKLYKLAEKDGFPKKQIDLAIACRNDEAKAQRHIDEQKRSIVTLKMMRFKAVDQLELFAKENSAEQAYEDGRLAALQDEPARAPTHLPTNAANKWLEGHAAGVRQISMSRAAEMTGPRPAVALAPIGDAPPTDTEADDAERKAA